VPSVRMRARICFGCGWLAAVCAIWMSRQTLTGTAWRLCHLGLCDGPLGIWLVPHPQWRLAYIHVRTRAVFQAPTFWLKAVAPLSIDAAAGSISIPLGRLGGGRAPVLAGPRARGPSQGAPRGRPGGTGTGRAWPGIAGDMHHEAPTAGSH
jgi:hypothetical protein